MENKRTIRIATLSPECSLKELLVYIGKIVEMFPDAKVESANDYDDYSYYITLEVDKTPLDLELEAKQKEVRYCSKSYVPDRVVVISQDTPISSEQLEAIKMDGKNDKYYLHLGGRVLERYLTSKEIKKLQTKADKEFTKRVAENEKIRTQVRELHRLQDEQDDKYKLEAYDVCQTAILL
jgi:hypothetical protein